ncbi:MAG: alpha/beta hydrolase [Vicinamibacterales bacterium]
MIAKPNLSLVGTFFVVALASVELSGQSRERTDLRVNVGVAALNVTAWGSGENVVLIPGAGGSSRDYDVLGPAIAAEGFRAIAINARGVRGSTGSLDNLSLHDYAKDVARLIEQLAGGRAHILGPAVGGRIARCVAVDWPDRAATVTVVAAGGKVAADPDARAAVDRYFDDPTITTDGLRKIAETVLLAPGSDPAPLLAARENWPAARAAVARASRETPVDEWWLGGRSPMLVIQGLNDRVAPAANGRMLRDAAPNRVTLVELENTGHMAVFERPKEVVRAAVAFWRAHPIK